MKNKTKYIISGLLILAISACTKKDLTNLQPDGMITPSTFYITDEQAMEALYAAYDPLQFEVWTGSTFMWGSIASDDATAGGADQSDQLDFQLVDRFQLTPYTSKDQNNWQAYKQWWQLVARSNYVIYNMKLNDDIAKSAIDQAYFLKAFGYFQLTRLYGGLPIIDKVPISTDKFPRASQTETWAAIERYLNKALADGKMPVRSLGADPDDGEATLAAAQTLLGKVYLYEGKYQECINILKQVDGNSQYSLEPIFMNVFAPGNKHGKESIFEINFSNINYNSAGWDNTANSNTIYTLLAPRTDGTQEIPAPATFSWGWGMNQPTQKLAAAFDAMGDTARKNHSMVSSDSINNIFAMAGKTTIFQNSETGWWDLKHARQKGWFAATNQVNQNLIVFRLADVYLMLAEAYNKTGDDNNALLYLNKVRVRAKLSAASGSGSDLLQKIKDERRLELCLEGDRYFDLVRWGDAATILTAESYEPSASSFASGTPGTVTNGLFPIPQQEINAYGNTANFTQNPGY